MQAGSWLAGGLILSVLSAAQANGSERPPVDLLLVLANDTSGSVYQGDLMRRRDAYRAAMTHPRVLHAVQSGPFRRIAVAYVEWSGDKKQRLLVDWMIIDGPRTAALFSARMSGVRYRSFAGGTAIGSALDFCVGIIKRAPFVAERAVIDISGDGTDNGERDVQRARDDAVRQGIVINGLPTARDEPTFWDPTHTHPPGGLPAYYRNNVAGGPGSFVVPVDGRDLFRDAILKKFIAEIAFR
jgi:hypothetical protein